MVLKVWVSMAAAAAAAGLQEPRGDETFLRAFPYYANMYGQQYAMDVDNAAAPLPSFLAPAGA